MTTTIEDDVAAVGVIDAIPKLLEVLCRSTGMGFAAVARVTEDRWVACAVRDEIDFGLAVGGELEVKTTLCDEIRASGQAVIIEDVAGDEDFHGHPTLARDVGAALGKNPWPIVAPCHRVTAAGGKPGGFSARGGVNTKLKLLGIEGAAAAAQADLFA